jgi:hypothetical protein
VSAEAVRPGDTVTVGKGTRAWRVAWIAESGQACLHRIIPTGPRTAYAHVDRLRKAGPDTPPACR